MRDMILDESEVLESGEETFFPALHVGLEKTSAVVSFPSLLRESVKLQFVKLSLSLLGNFSKVVSRVSIAGTILRFFNFCHSYNLVSPGIQVLVLVLKRNHVQ
ncbi:hypothetical protein V8G54_034602 [Vigna mungo]|uniref:Uncharacterized protein n=1 Tax=Vigna mungo TaxID=3915 RepID=A0AAQ3MQ10_VIGMU